MYVAFFSRLVALHFEPLIKRKQAITSLDDSLMQAQTKQEMFTIIHEYHQLLRKAGLKAALFKYQVIITKFQNLKIIWTKGSNLAFPDILSRNVTLKEIKNLQKLHKGIPRDISL